MSFWFQKPKQNFERLEELHSAKNVQSCGSWRSVFSLVTESRNSKSAINEYTTNKQDYKQALFNISKFSGWLRV